MTFNEMKQWFFGDVNWFVDFCSNEFAVFNAIMDHGEHHDYLVSKWLSKYRALICFYCSRVSWQVNSYPDQYITGRIPGYLGIFPRPNSYLNIWFLILGLGYCAVSSWHSNHVDSLMCDFTYTIWGVWIESLLWSD